MLEITSRRAPVACPCRFAVVEHHHNRLVRAPSEVAMALDLLELAVTWGEIDYSREAVIPPADWLEFADQHQWAEPEVALRLFGAALEIARRGPMIVPGHNVATTNQMEAQ